MAAMPNQISVLAVQMQKLARLKKFDELESALLNAIEAGPLTREDMAAVLEVVVEQNDAKRTESLSWLVLSMWTERKGPEAGLDIVRIMAGLLPQSETVRAEAAELYRKAFAQKVPQTEPLIEMTLGRKNTPLPLAVQQMDKFIDLLSRPYVLDANAKVPGRIVGLNVERKELTVALTHGEKGYDPVAILKLEPLAPDDFRARAAFEPAALRKLADENPEEFVRLTLKTFGPTLSFRELKAHLTQVILSGAWSKWWTAAKVQLHRSALIEMTDSNQPTLTLRAKPLAYEDRIRRQFDETNSFEDQLAVILAYLDAHHDQAAPDEPLLGAFMKALLPRIHDADESVKLAARAVLIELRKKFPPPVEFPFQPPADPAMLLTNLYNDDVAKLILNYLRAAQPETWYELWAAIMPGASIAMCEWIAAELTKDGVREPLTQAVQSILHWPDKFVRGIVWLYKAACAGNPPEYLAATDCSTVLTGLLSAAQILKRKPPITNPEQQRRALTQIKNAVSADNYALVRNVLETAGHEYAGYLRDTVPRNQGLGDAMNSDIVKIIRETHPTLFSRALPPWEEDAIYTTKGALDRKNDEFAKLVNVDIAHNAKTIGEAADRGDLSENAEFTAALEERDRLTERASRMRADLKKAKVIHHGMADTDFVTVGSRVRTVNLTTNESETLVFLGPWDADPQRGVYSYLSPIAQSFMGKKAGEVVTHNAASGQTQWKIEEIGPGT